MIHTLTEDTFEEFIKQAETPVLVDYWAEWCQPCKVMLPVLKQVAEELDGRLTVAKVDIEKNNGLAKGLSSVPTIKLFVNGEVVTEVVGAKPKAVLLQKLDGFL